MSDHAQNVEVSILDPGRHRPQEKLVAIVSHAEMIDGLPTTGEKPQMAAITLAQNGSPCWEPMPIAPDAFETGKKYLLAQIDATSTLRQKITLSRFQREALMQSQTYSRSAINVNFARMQGNDIASTTSLTVGSTRTKILRIFAD